MKSLKIDVRGLVQGVGFRPFVYALAARHSLKGRVWNDSEGVKIEICGDEKACENFLFALTNELPPLARIDELRTEDFKFETLPFKFEIVASKETLKTAPILPDFAICEDCKREFYDPSNRRYHHPFINCTNCGPRFSIIRALPYDRANTTMSEFALCSECEREYKDPADRRYHAQPVACPKCGAEIFLRDMDGRELAKGEEAARVCAKAIKEGKIVGVKGIGGFHLVCDATNEGAVKLLRERKRRPDKPLAIMARDLAMAELYAVLSESERGAMSSNLKPIVLAKSRGNLPAALAPNLDKIGVFIAPTALHLLLFEYLDVPIVATSANISGEPIITDFDALRVKLSQVCDFALDNNREILNASDDSVCFCADSNDAESALQWLRVSRGLRPQIAPAKSAKKGCFIALGAEMKNTFAIYRDGQIFSSPYVGDLKNVATFERYLALISMFERVYDFKFDFAVGDLHPLFANVRYFERDGLEVKKIQHHAAHALSVAYEADVKNALCFSFDGTGYGADGSIWGGEAFWLGDLDETKRAALENAGFKFETQFDGSNLSRIAHFDYFPLIGGEAAIKNIHRLAFAILRKYNIAAPDFFARLDETEAKNTDVVLRRAKIRTSSLGRVFDAFAALVLARHTATYDAQAPMELEALYDETCEAEYGFKFKNGIIDYREAFERALKDPPRVAASAFINGLARLISNLSIKAQTALNDSNLNEKTVEFTLAQAEQITRNAGLDRPKSGANAPRGGLGIRQQEGGESRA